MTSYYQQSETTKSVLKALCREFSVMNLAIACFKSAMEVKEEKKQNYEFVDFLFSFVVENDHSFQYSFALKEAFTDELFETYFAKLSEKK